MGAIVKAVEEGLAAVAAVAGEVKQRDAEENTAAQESNAAAAELQKVRDQAAQAEQSQDPAAIDKLTQP